MCAWIERCGIRCRRPAACSSLSNYLHVRRSIELWMQQPQNHRPCHSCALKKQDWALLPWRREHLRWLWGGETDWCLFMLFRISGQDCVNVPLLTWRRSWRRIFCRDRSFTTSFGMPHQFHWVGPKRDCHQSALRLPYASTLFGILYSANALADPSHQRLIK